MVDGVEVYRSKGKNQQKIDEKYQGTWERVKKITRIFPFLYHINYVARSKEVDVLHAHSTFFCALSAWAVARWVHKPVVYEVRSLWEERSKGEGIASKLSYWLIHSLETLSCRIVDGVVTINNGLKADLITRGIPEEKILVVPNSVEKDVILTGEKSESAKEENGLAFGYVGNLSNIEGIELLIDTFMEIVQESSSKIKLLIYGKGPLAENIAEKIQRAGTSNIHFGGAFKRDDLIWVYNDIDVIVIPRLPLEINEKVTPLKPLEALAFGKALLLSDVGGLQEVVQDYEGLFWFFKSGDKNALKKKMEEAIEYFTKHPKSAHMEGAMKYIKEKRSWDAAAKMYIDFYERLI